MAAKNEAIVIPAIERNHVTIKLVGDSPLIMHKWSQKAKEMMVNPNPPRAGKREPRNPMRDFITSMYWLTEEPTEYTEEAFEKAIADGAKFGFPSTAFKESAVAGAYRAGAIKNKVSAYAGFHIPGEFVQIGGDAPVMREDMVRVGMGTADIRWRGEFRNWTAEVNVVYSPAIISLEQLVNLFNLGGFTCGVGEWRVEKGGSNGMYHVE